MSVPAAIMDRLKFCNCASCHKELLGDSFRDWYYDQEEQLQVQLPPPVAGRINGRPYCADCVEERTARLKGGR